jgi:hypothetical protein
MRRKCFLAAVLFFALWLSGGAAWAGVSAANGEPVEDDPALADYLADLFHLVGAFGDGVPDLLNVDFRDFDMDESSARLIQFARRFTEERSNDDWVTCMLDAGVVTTLLREAFGIALSLKDIGMYTYDAGERAFVFPFGEPGLNPNFVRPIGFFDNPDGTRVMTADLLWSDYAGSLKDSDLQEEVPYGIAANLTVTYAPHLNYELFPVRILSISSPMYDWDAAEGMYLSPDGLYTLAFRNEPDPRWRYGRIYVTFTDNTTGETYLTDGPKFGNSAALYYHSGDIDVEAYISLSAGTLTISVFPEWPFGGVYHRISGDQESAK